MLFIYDIKYMIYDICLIFKGYYAHDTVAQVAAQGHDQQLHAQQRVVLAALAV